MSALRSRLRQLNPFRSAEETEEDIELKKRQHFENNEFTATEHLLSLEELSSLLGTTLNQGDPAESQGMNSAAAMARLLEEGKNILSPPKTTPEIVKFLLHFTNFFMLLLLFAATFSCITYGLDSTQLTPLYVGIFLYCVVVLDCVISYLQERASSDVMKTFSKMLPQKCKVIRDGTEREITAEELVRGDVVKFTIGDKIPADLRIIFSQQAKVEASSITGESIPIALVAEKTSERPTESRNITFNGSLCLNGEAIGVVFRTGDNTLVGQIARLAGAQSSKPTTLQLEIKHLVKFLAIVSSCCAIIFFVIGMARGQRFLDVFVNGFIVVILAFLPCGLPTAVTSIISICAKKMAKKNVYVKKLDIVETLGSTSLIASDKTGTLTQNVMTVVSFWYGGDFINVHSTNGTNSIALVDLLEDPGFKPVLQCASLCNRARYSDEGTHSTMTTPLHTEFDPHGEASVRSTTHFSPGKNEFSVRSVDSVDTGVLFPPEKERTILGDASDVAIFKFVNTLGLAERLRKQHRKLFEIPFNSTNKYSLIIVNNPILGDDGAAANRHTLFLKGAPEIVLAKCSKFCDREGIKEITPSFSDHVQTALRRSGASGERVLAFASIDLETPLDSYTEDPPNFPTSDLVFLGLVCLVDPPRPNVPDAIKTLKMASIKVLMVTGDHPITAEAIARKVNIIGSCKTKAEVAAMRGVPADEVLVSDEEVGAVVVAGSELTKFSEEDWTTVLNKKEIVFARTTPTQKLEIVQRNQALGHVVAVTGDGVNDSPALKAADVGVAMGIMGSDVAREAADIILITDDFAAILDAVKMGRLIFDNLKKTIAYTLPHAFAEVIPILCTLAFSIPIGLTSIFILCADLGTEMALYFPRLRETRIQHHEAPSPQREDRQDGLPSGSHLLLHPGRNCRDPGVHVCLLPGVHPGGDSRFGTALHLRNLLADNLTRFCCWGRDPERSGAV